MNQAQRQIFYQEQHDQHTRKSEGFQRQLHALGTLRLLLFSIAFACFFLLNGLPLLSITLIAFVIFLALVKRSANIRYLRDKHRKCAELNTLELNVQQGDWSGFPDGAAYVNSKHCFSTDMDVFGKGSFYQLINRTVSLEGNLAFAAVFHRICLFLFAEWTSIIEYYAHRICDFLGLGETFGKHSLLERQTPQMCRIEHARAECSTRGLVWIS